MQVLTFEPYYKSVIWGGERIARFKEIASKGNNIGESWEISPMEGHESVITTEGPLKGQTLNSVVEQQGDALMGRRLVERFNGKFPLLVKIIDSNADLSIQVHPDDALAATRHNSFGKTEMWYSLDPAENAYLYAGFNRKITPKDYRARIENNTIVSTLSKFFTRPADVFFLPAGRVHAIGAGNLVLEIQEASDITYRIYDYDRRDAQGRARELHVEQSIDAVNYDDTFTPGRVPNVPAVADKQTEVLSNPFFTITIVGVRGTFQLPLKERDSFTILFVTRGEVEITDPEGHTTTLRKGQSALVPASTPSLTLKGDADVITSYIS